MKKKKKWDTWLIRPVPKPRRTQKTWCHIRERPIRFAIYCWEPLQQILSKLFFFARGRSKKGAAHRYKCTHHLHSPFTESRESKNQSKQRPTKLSMNLTRTITRRGVAFEQICGHRIWFEIVWIIWFELVWTDSRQSEDFTDWGLILHIPACSLRKLWLRCQEIK